VQPEKFIAQAVRSIHTLADVSKISQVYETAPYSVMDQPYYWNLAMEIQTDLSEKELKEKLLRLERESGRIRSADKSAPRTLDVDILIYDGQWNFEGHSTITYPLSERAFVLVPLSEIVPDLTDPQSGKKLIELLASRAYAGQPIKCLGSWMNTPVGIENR
jgi:2-amino-4-hydroxy-6-hydroxymethyldihydropteridine diphosphokinase